MTVQLSDLTPEQLAEAARLHAESVAAAEAAKQAGAPAGEDASALPQWARDAIKRGNDEAARFRTELRAAQDKLGAAKTPEEYQAAIAEWQTKTAETETSLSRELAQVRFDLPPVLAARLVGKTREEIFADAKTLAESLNPDGTQQQETPGSEQAQREQRLGGGLNGHQRAPQPETYDPAALALEHVKATRGAR